jgi:hypothetical protein
VVAAALSPDHLPLHGMDFRFELMRLRPLPGERIVWWVNRCQGLDPNATMADVGDDYADALRTIFYCPVDVMAISTGGSVAVPLTADRLELKAHLAEYVAVL